ncbi:hypothetical protein AUEXF2481DRAFT_499420 [Aureobasidium subglaciale EXF-2481]|uniref:Uncharacterized protein n=1 Tax=Aureobasidium subglaciale (strain EXF-2481) TaxID=1043005 RepID=A0A074YB11_AURSE|nr:uncharacterized protein AUEXF2481DRAFT_499420 [Aureobasidium subglaciale EXF-2481]KEQ91357.1 hypothetical protein AUEXF2481DRAFT_499420 [Aureobasidium subglaciale EXF-2481]
MVGTNVANISVSYVNIARIPFFGLEADLALDVFFSYFSLLYSPITIFSLPNAGILHPLHPLLLSFVHLQQALGGHEHRTFPMFLHTRDYIKYSTETQRILHLHKQTTLP